MSSHTPTILEKPNNSAKINSSNVNTLTATITDGISKATSRERLQGLNLLPSARIQPRPFSNKYFFKRPRLLQYYAQGALVDSHGRRREPSLEGSVLVKREASNARANAGGEVGVGGGNRGMEDGAEQQGQGQGEVEVAEGADDPEDGKVQRGERPGRLLCVTLHLFYPSMRE
jgi:hypothetical protein